MLSERKLSYLDALGDGAVHDVVAAYFEQQKRIAELEADMKMERSLSFRNQVAGLEAERDDWIACHAKVFRELQECKTLVANKCQRIAELEAQLAAERERCAMVCDEIAEIYQESESRLWPELRTDAQSGAEMCAAAIRKGESK